MLLTENDKEIANNSISWVNHEGNIFIVTFHRHGRGCPDLLSRGGTPVFFTFHEIAYQNKNLQKYDEEEYWKRYNEGKKFFSKYFLDLWD